MSKTKNLTLGKVMKPNGNALFSFDENIKEIQLTVETFKDGETVTEIVKVTPNGKYLSGAFINKFKENLDFRLDKGWISQEKYESELAYGEKQSISSVFSVKVESK